MTLVTKLSGLPSCLRGVLLASVLHCLYQLWEGTRDALVFEQLLFPCALSKVGGGGHAVEWIDVLRSKLLF